MREEAAARRSDLGVSAADIRYRRIYDAHYRRILAYCLRRVESADAQDAAAEVFTIVWRRLSDVPTGDGQLPWLYGVAYRVVSHQWRAAGRRSRLTTRLAAVRPQPTQSIDDQVVMRRDLQLVTEAVARLKPLDREVLQLVMWEKMSHKQVAEVIGSTAPAVKQRFYRAKRRLAREFKKLGGTFHSPDAAQTGGGS